MYLKLLKGVYLSLYSMTGVFFLQGGSQGELFQLPSGDERMQQVEFHLFHLPATISIPLVAPEEEIRWQLERKKARKKPERQDDKDRKLRWTATIYISWFTTAKSTAFSV